MLSPERDPTELENERAVELRKALTDLGIEDRRDVRFSIHDSRCSADAREAGEQVRVLLGTTTLVGGTDGAD